MVKPEIFKIIEEEAKRSGTDFEPYREMLLKIPDGPTVKPNDCMDSLRTRIEKTTEEQENLPKLHHLSNVDNLMDDPRGPQEQDSYLSSPHQEWNCSACGIVFPLIHDLVIHLVTDHVNFESKQRPRTNAAAIKCPMCVGTYLDTVESLLHHYDTTHVSRLRLFNDVTNREQMGNLIVRVNKKHISTVRAAYGDGIYATRYKWMCDEFDRVKENSDLILLDEEGVPLSALVTHSDDKTVLCKKSEFETPNSCPLCPQVMQGDADYFVAHLQTHDPQAFQKWKRTKLERLKQEMEWKCVFDRKQRELVRERYCTVSNQVQAMRVRADRETEKELMPKGASPPRDTPPSCTNHMITASRFADAEGKTAAPPIQCRSAASTSTAVTSAAPVLDLPTASETPSDLKNRIMITSSRLMEWKTAAAPIRCQSTASASTVTSASPRLASPTTPTVASRIITPEDGAALCLAPAPLVNLSSSQLMDSKTASSSIASPDATTSAVLAVPITSHATVPTVSLTTTLSPTPLPFVKYRINRSGAPKKLISVIHQTQLCYPPTEAEQSAPKLEREGPADGSEDLRIMESPILAQSGTRRTMKRRDLVATNRVSRTKPLTAKKLLSLSCMRCGVIFENRCKYTRHLLDHKNEANSYRCLVKGCLTSFSSSLKLRNHMHKQHPDAGKDFVEAACNRGDDAVKMNADDTPIQMDHVDSNFLRPSSTQSRTVQGSNDMDTSDFSDRMFYEDEVMDESRDSCDLSSTSCIDFVNGQLVVRDMGEMSDMNSAFKDEAQSQTMDKRGKVKQEPLDEYGITITESSVPLHLFGGSPVYIKEEEGYDKQQPTLLGRL